MPKANSIQDLAFEALDFAESYDDSHEEVSDRVISWVLDNYLDTEIIQLYLQEDGDDRTFNPDFTWPREGGTLREGLLLMAAHYLAEVVDRIRH